MGRPRRPVLAAPDPDDPMPQELAVFDEATWIARLDPPRPSGQAYSARLLWRHERRCWFKDRGMKAAASHERLQWSMEAQERKPS
jgi:hypothetical protein